MFELLKESDEEGNRKKRKHEEGKREKHEDRKRDKHETREKATFS